jgi:S1-C subfamily serine protease
LVNIDGDLIGINTAIATPTGVFAGYSFAVPANLVQKIVKEIKENGDIQRARLGVMGDSVDPELIKEHRLKTDTGFYVARLEPGSAAQLAGILPGDVIVEANGNSIGGYDDLVDVMEFAKVGDTINLKVNRKNKLMTIAVRLVKGI